MKDFFSGHAHLYRAFRPGYPPALIEHILSFVSQKHTAWDCATGNGQAAVLLAPHFRKIHATDISPQQLAAAPTVPNIEYGQCPAEQTPFGAGTFDLITVAQAFHWFDWPAFHQEVKRVAKKDGIIAIWMYDRFETAVPALNALIDDFYYSTTGPYWDERRKYVEEHYASLPFPYEPLPAPDFTYDTVWSKEQLSGYLSSWSAVQQYIKVKGTSPVVLIEKELDQLMPNPVAIRFPIYLKIGRIAD